MNIALVVMSCDNYEDIWKPFFDLKSKYWADCPYETYLITETKDSKYAKTIKTTGSWTKRLREALKQIDSEYILLMLDDYFIHSKVDNNKIEECLKTIKETNAIVYNFELKYRQGVELDNTYDIQLNNQIYLNSTQPSIWNRERLIERLEKDQNPWEFELTKVNSPYLHLINNTNGKIIDTGYNLTHEPWGIVQGKWSRETKELFDREGMEVDYEKRGFYN